MVRLRHVLNCGIFENGLWVQMEYIGKQLSVNHYKVSGYHTRRDVQKWMDDLATMVTLLVCTQKLQVNPPLTVEIRGKFRDRRSRPDLHNLHKVIADALEAGLGIDDQHIGFRDGDVEVGCDDPHISIRIHLQPVPDLSETVSTCET